MVPGRSGMVDRISIECSIVLKDKKKIPPASFPCTTTKQENKTGGINFKA
jgi:hypothetical protein